jgi:hypothetical protein
MQRVEADRNNVHQHCPHQQCAGDAATEQKEGHSLNHHQDRTKDYSWNGAKGEEQAKQLRRGLRHGLEAGPPPPAGPSPP